MELLSRLPVRGLCKGGNLKLSGPGAKADLTQESAKVAPLAAGRGGTVERFNPITIGRQANHDRHEIVLLATEVKCIMMDRR